MSSSPTLLIRYYAFLRVAVAILNTYSIQGMWCYLLYALTRGLPLEPPILVIRSYIHYYVSEK